MDEQQKSRESQQPELFSAKEQHDALEKSVKDLRKGLGLTGLFLRLSELRSHVGKKRRPVMRRRVHYLISSKSPKAGSNKSKALDAFLSKKEAKGGRDTQNR